MAPSNFYALAGLAWQLPFVGQEKRALDLYRRCKRIRLSWALGHYDDVTMSDEESAAAGFPPRRRFNLTTAYSFAAPTGRYELGADDNIGLGFWTHQFQGFGYYFPFEHRPTREAAGPVQAGPPPTLRARP